MAMLLTQVLHKFQFRYNQSQLDELDDETLDEDVSWSDFMAFQHLCANCDYCSRGVEKLHCRDDDSTKKTEMMTPPRKQGCPYFSLFAVFLDFAVLI
jgi:hypothetical protein